MPTLADINLDTLRPPGNPSDFVVLERPMFKEHWTRECRDEDGAISSESTYLGRDELRGIADRCNERIADTGDFAPIIINHTTDDGQVENEIIGFSGPYRVGTFGNLKPKATIYGKMWVFKGKEEKLRQFPRLSVEYWCSEENPADGYFDPVSLLGARTPELDLGVHYSKDATGRRLMRYSKEERFRYEAASPGGSNTSVPALASVKDRDGDDRDGSGKGDKPEQYSKEPDGMATTLTPADIQQIVAALVPVVAQQVNEAVAGMKVMNANEGDGLGDGLGDELDSQGGDDPGDLGDGLDLEGDSDLDLGDDLDGLDMDDDGDADAADGEDLDGDGDVDLPPDIDDEDSDFGLGDDDDTDLDESNGLPGGDVADEPDEDNDSPEASGADEKDNPMAGKAPEKKPDEKGKDKPMSLQQYAKENGELRRRYEKTTIELRDTKSELDSLKARVGTIEADKKKAVRYSKLDGLRTQGFVINVDEELADTDPLNDEQFEKHCTKIVERYAKAPVGRTLYIPPSEKRDGVPADEKVHRYAKVAGDIALDLQKKGKPVDYAAIRANVEKNDGKYVPAA